ncbi:MAG: ABC transporter permease [Bdellovibrionales bacterium]|nr:ABC transporter permease [Bdellovibrionales bacterium]
MRWTPFWVLFRREIKRYLKVLVQTIFAPMISSTLYLLIFGVSLGSQVTVPGGISYLAFLIPGLVMMSCLNNCFQNSSSSIVSAKFAGDLEDLKVAPLSHTQMLWAFAFGGLTRGLTVGTITFLVGELFFYLTTDQWLGIAHPGWLLFFLTLGGLTFAKIGVSVAFWAESVDQLSAVSSFVLLPLLYLGGVFFSVENLHPLWKSVSHANPLLYLINGVRYGILGQADVAVGTAALVAVLALGLFHLLGLWSLRRGPYGRW